MGGYFFGEEVNISLYLAQVPRLTRVLLSSCVAKKKVSKEEGDPGSVPAAPVPCATRFGRGLRNSGLKPLKQCSPFFRPSLRCSAPPKGPGKPSGAGMGAATIGTGAKAEVLIFGLFSRSTATGQFSQFWLSRDVFRAPLRGAEQPRNAGGCRLALSEPQASLASRPAFRVAQGTGRSPAPTQGSPFSFASDEPRLWLLSFGEAKESTPASRAEPQANYEAEKAKPC